MKIFRKLNSQGFSHEMVLVLFVAIFAIAGVYYLVASHADNISWTTVASTGSGNNAADIRACQKLVSTAYGNVYQVSIQYIKPVSVTGFYGYTVLDGRTQTDRDSKTGTTYTNNVSPVLTAYASQPANDYMSIFEVSNGTTTSSTHVNPATLASCSSATPVSSNVTVPAPATTNTPTAAQVAESAQKLENTKIGPYQKESSLATPSKVSAGASANPSVYTTSNWSGYVATGNIGKLGAEPFSSVVGNTIIPTVTCNAADSSGWVVDWVGLDGWSDTTVEQDGIGSDCVAGNSSTGYIPVYEAWWDMYSNGQGLTVFQFKNQKGLESTALFPGDVVQMQVATYGSYYVLKVTDLTLGYSNYALKTCSASATCNNSSAEWIVERPAGDTATDSGYYPLLQYSPVNWYFNTADDYAAVSGNQVTSAFPYYQIDMQNGSDSLAVTSQLDDNGSGFYDFWQGAQ